MGPPLDSNLELIEVKELFLESNLLRDPLLCDSRLKWLKDRVWEFQNRVLHANCNNDKGQTAFTSTLIN